MGDVMNVLFEMSPYKTNKTRPVRGFLVRCYSIVFNVFAYFAPPFAYDEYTLYTKKRLKKVKKL